jgi:hypothetical protein
MSVTVDKLFFPDRQAERPVADWLTLNQKVYTDSREGDAEVHVLSISHHKQSIHLQHESLVCHFRHGEKENQLVAERSLSGEPGATLRLASESPRRSSRKPSQGLVPAKDCVTVSAYNKGLQHFKLGDEIRRLTFPRMRVGLLQFATMAYVVNETAPEFDIWGAQCYWFADALFNGLRQKFDGTTIYFNRREGLYRGLNLQPTTDWRGLLEKYDELWNTIRSGIVEVSFALRSQF